MIKHYKIFLLLFFFSGVIYAQDFELQNGDLIFQQSCTAHSDNTIKVVTSSISDYRFTHVGMVYIDEKDSIYVLEATIPKVTLTPLREYLISESGCNPVSVTGRLDEEYRHLIAQALEIGFRLIDKEYDYGYVLGNDMYYCSELIYEILKQANNGKEVFPLNVMTFKSTETGQITKGWIDYFTKYGLPIPEGEMGINQGAMSLSNNVHILGEIINMASRNDSSNHIWGLLTDSLGRCVHYSSALDIVANKCYSCNKYYACYKCHNTCEDHDLEPWPIGADDNSEEKIVLCGNCFKELSVSEYKKNYSCINCKKKFNPNCSLHHSIYFKEISNFDNKKDIY